MKVANTSYINKSIIKPIEPRKKHKYLILIILTCFTVIVMIALPIIFASFDTSRVYAVDLYHESRKIVKPASWALMNFIISMVGLIFAFLITSSIFFYNKNISFGRHNKKRNIPISLICVLAFSFAGILFFFLTQSFRGMPVFINSRTPVHVILFIITMINFIAACKYIK